MGAILPLAIVVGTILGLVIGVISLVLFIRAKHKTGVGSWLQYILVSITSTLGICLLIGLWAAVSVEEFQDLFVALICLGATPGLGLFAGLRWSQRERPSSASSSPPEIES